MLNGKWALVTGATAASAKPWRKALAGAGANVVLP